MDSLYSIIARLQERPVKSTGFSSSMFKGITIAEFLDTLDVDSHDHVKITVNGTVYDENQHSFMLIDKITFKQDLVRKEFKEKLVVKLSRLDDVLRVAPETTRMKSTYGYVTKLDIKIKTK